MRFVTLAAALQSREALWTVSLLSIFAVACSWVVRSRSSESLKRGVQLIERRRGLRPPRLRRSANTADAVTLAGRLIPFADEAKHFKLIGATGTGKSTAIRELLKSALARGDRAVFADPDGGYCRRFFRPYRGDVLLNPFERDSVKWNPFAEIQTPYDVEQLSLALIPSSDDASSDEWRAYSRTFLAAVLRYCHVCRRPSANELWRLLAVAPVEELREIVQGTPAQPFLDPDNGRMFGSIRSVTVSAMAALEFIQAQRSTPFSVRDWVRTRSSQGVLFIPYRAGQIAALRSLIATWMRLAIFEAMDASEDHDQRLWFVVDELDALGAIAGLKDALARLRKFGGRCVLGFQSISQVSGTYGTSAAQTIIENCGTTLILRCSSSESGGTSQFASRLIGEREIVRRQIAHGSDRGAFWSTPASRRSRNVSEQHVSELAVLPSQIEQLPDLCGYLKSASSPEWRKVFLDAKR